jgi:hypothetical protein
LARTSVSAGHLLTEATRKTITVAFLPRPSEIAASLVKTRGYWQTPTANAITGTNWNGFAFFGIKRAPSSNKNAAGPRRNKLGAISDARAAPVSPLKTKTGNRRA